MTMMTPEELAPDDLAAYARAVGLAAATRAEAERAGALADALDAAADEATWRAEEAEDDALAAGEALWAL